MIRKAGNGEAGCAAIALAIVIAIITVGVTGALMATIDTSGNGDTRGTAIVSGDGTKSTTNGTILFEEDFEASNLAGWTVNHATVQSGSFFGEGTKLLQLHAETNKQASAFYTNNTWSNYTLEATIEIGDSYNAWSEVYMYFLTTSYNYFIKLDTRNDTISFGYEYYVYDMFGGWYYTNITHTTYLDVRANTPYILKISVQGQDVKVHVNDVLKFDLESIVYSTSGGIGFKAIVPNIGNTTGWFKMNIDNIRVTKSQVIPVTGSILFEDDFEDGNFNGWSINHAYMQNGSLDSGNFMVQLQSDNTSAYPMWNASAGVTSGLSWNNYQLELSVKIVTGLVIVGIYLPTSNCYDVGNCYGYWLFLNPETDHISMLGQQASYPLNYNTYYNVKLSIFDGNISAFIEGNKVLSAYSTSRSAGTIGIVAPTLWNEESTCYFDNVKITQLDATIVPVLSVDSDSVTYLPGDLVTLTASYLGMNSTKVVFNVDFPSGTSLVTQSKIVPSGGSVDFSFSLPNNAPYGDYLVQAMTYDGEAQTSFKVVVSGLRVTAMNVPDAHRNSTVNIIVTVNNGEPVMMNFILVVQVIDSNGVPLSPAIAQRVLNTGQTSTYSHSIHIPGGSPTGEYRVQAQILTGLPSDGGYALDFMNGMLVVL